MITRLFHSQLLLGSGIPSSSIFPTPWSKIQTDTFMRSPEPPSLNLHTCGSDSCTKRFSICLHRPSISLFLFEPTILAQTGNFCICPSSVFSSFIVSVIFVHIQEDSLSPSPPFLLRRLLASSKCPALKFSFSASSLSFPVRPRFKLSRRQIFHLCPFHSSLTCCYCRCAPQRDSVFCLLCFSGLWSFRFEHAHAFFLCLLAPCLSPFQSQSLAQTQLLPLSPHSCPPSLQTADISMKRISVLSKSHRFSPPVTFFHSSFATFAITLKSTA